MRDAELAFQRIAKFAGGRVTGYEQKTDCHQAFLAGFSSAPIKADAIVQGAKRAGVSASLMSGGKIVYVDNVAVYTTPRSDGTLLMRSAL